MLQKPTFEEQVRASKIMGYFGGALFAGFLLTITYSIKAVSLIREEERAEGLTA